MSWGSIDEDPASIPTTFETKGNLIIWKEFPTCVVLSKFLEFFLFLCGLTTSRGMTYVLWVATTFGVTNISPVLTCSLFATLLLLLLYATDLGVADGSSMLMIKVGRHHTGSCLLIPTSKVADSSWIAEGSTWRTKSVLFLSLKDFFITVWLVEALSL